MSSDDEQESPRKPPWLLLIAAGLVTGVVGAVIALNVYRGTFALTRARLDEARQRWVAARVLDYDMAVFVSGSTTARYDLQFRAGQLVQAHQDGQPFEHFARAQPWTVEGLFDTVLEEDLTNEADPTKPRAVLQAAFDPVDGHLVHYVRSANNQHVQIAVALTRR